MSKLEEIMAVDHTKSISKFVTQVVYIIFGTFLKLFKMLAKECNYLVGGRPAWSDHETMAVDPRPSNKN